MKSYVDWDAAEKLGVVLPLSDYEHIDISSGSLNVSGALHGTELPASPFVQMLGRPLMDETNNVQDAAKELLQTYGQKAVLIASDKATLASYARNETRRDFWIAVFTEIRGTHPKQAHVIDKENA